MQVMSSGQVYQITRTMTQLYFLQVAPMSTISEFMAGTSGSSMNAGHPLGRWSLLKGPQALVNVTTDIKYSGFFFWRQKKVYVSADVVQFK
ncbi:MAG: hypothetical protein C4548_00710 [Desulfobacteraceae bacterium]|nr:MAG: hypothetical protein C4548_00710 [Desulfobacteraceae bacterium]